MEQLRQKIRDALQRNPWQLPEFFRESMLAGRQNSLHQLWLNVSSYDNTTHLNACESLWTAFCFIDCGWDPLLPNDGGPRELQGNEAQAVVNLFHWASELALPSSAFAASFDETIEVTEAKAVICLPDRSVASSPDVILAMVSLASEQDPWTTEDTTMSASMHLDVTCQDGVFPIIESLLKEKIRPLFAKTKNPAITSEGRKNLHPIPLSRFDGSALDDSTKPWKNTDIYVTSVISWVISQYKPADKKHLEAHFPLLVPVILAFIDDSSIGLKTKGCELLIAILKPIQKSGSDILIRTNLISVFDDAVTPCLLSLPTITPEDSSLKILGAAYPALLSLLKAAYINPSTKKAQPQIEKDKETYILSLTKILRSNLIHSFHHISSSTPASATTSASFPHPRLSTFLLEWISTFVKELGIHTTKYLQDIVPALYTTLSNPFGTAHPPLLFAAVSATKSVILNTHPRVWRWRGELLGGLSACWLHVVSEIKEKQQNKDEKSNADVAELDKSRWELQSTVFVLKHALQNPVSGVEGGPDVDQLLAKESMQKELQELVNADPQLETLLFAEVKS
ncbi:uncharacterized protein N7459_004829 [Penicillium hispanicum]|uniref:uncharacterized protein n=1 Tax=Penicillium hispanicum TaxID=1080232 RepID=UPI002540C835|nr:uncharacterized protein N7459_004829 [Penicillium hispanicum]KAJ5585029.1 hypothetical protein N7459_004829 [Penicillium hispanicum]